MTVGRFWFDIKGYLMQPYTLWDSKSCGNKKGKIWAKSCLSHEALQQTEADLASARAAAVGAPQVAAESPAPSCGPPGAGLQQPGWLNEKLFLHLLVLNGRKI